MTPSPRTRKWIASCILTVVALGIGAVALWRSAPSAAVIDAALPPVPDLSARPSIMGDSVSKAMAETRASDTRWHGIATLGRLYHANNFHAEAAACWQLLRAREPHEPRWWYYLADLRRSAGDQEGMAALLQETLRLAPGYAAARLRMADLQFKTGQVEAAETNYRLRLATLPRDPYARLGLARVALQSGRGEDASQLLETLLKDAPHFSTAHNLYAECLAAAGDESGAARHRWLGQETLRYREAEDPWLDELDTWCHDYERLCARGTLEFLGERHDLAVDYFTRAISLEPGEPRAYELLAGLHLARNEPGKARELLTTALPGLTGRKSHRYFTTLSRACRELDRHDEAIRVAREGLAQAVDEPELYDALGTALADAGRHEESVDIWQAGLERSPNDASMNYNLAISLLELRRLDDALAALDRSLTLQPTFLPTLLLRGEIELRAQHLELADKYLRPALQAHPESLQARRLMAVWHLQMGIAAEAMRDNAGAEQHYRAGLALGDGPPDLLVRLGVLCLVSKRFAEALEPLNAYHSLYPQDPHACLFLGQAYAATGQRDKAREILTTGARLADEAGKTATAHNCRRILEKL